MNKSVKKLEKPSNITLAQSEPFEFERYLGNISAFKLLLL